MLLNIVIKWVFVCDCEPYVSTAYVLEHGKHDPRRFFFLLLDDDKRQVLEFPYKEGPFQPGPHEYSEHMEAYAAKVEADKAKKKDQYSPFKLPVNKFLQRKGK